MTPRPLRIELARVGSRVRMPSWSRCARRPWATRVLSLGVGVLGACGESATAPAEVAAAIEAVAGTATQEVEVGAAVPQRPAVRVRSASGRPVAGVTVRFTVQDGDGTLSGEQATSDENGLAATGSWTVGRRAGVNRVVAAAAGLSPVTFVATARVGAPAQFTVIGGRQDAIVGRATPVAPALVVADRLGNGVPNLTVTWRIASDRGSLERLTTTTDSSGRARPGQWLVDRIAGVNSIIATVAAREFSFIAVGQPDQPAAITARSRVEWTLAVRAAMPESLVVRVVDGFGNAVPRQAVRFTVGTGRAEFTDSTVTTDDDGLARTRVLLGEASGLTTVTAQTATVTAEVARLTGVSLSEVDQVVVSISQTCAIGRAGVAFCWGWNGGAGLGDGSMQSRPRPVGVAGGWSFLTLGAEGVGGCGVTAVTLVLRCWGSNPNNRLGVGPQSMVLVPQPVLTTERFLSIDGFVLGQPSGFCALSESGDPFCWGRFNETGGPRRIAQGTRFRQLSVGGAHACAIDDAARAWCWGSNRVGDAPGGQLGDGTSIDRPTPTPVASAARFRAIAAGGVSTCGVTEGGQVLCWGGNGDAQVGDGTLTTRLVPVPVGGLPGPAIAVAVGFYHACALLADGRVFCWGSNRDGQLGTGVGSPSLGVVPRAVAGETRFVAVDAGFGHSCAIATTRQLFCWGRNNDGQLGDGTFIDRAVPTAVRF